MSFVKKLKIIILGFKFIRNIEKIVRKFKDIWNFFNCIIRFDCDFFGMICVLRNVLKGWNVFYLILFYIF